VPRLLGEQAQDGQFGVGQVAGDYPVIPALE
jgi:hypothetical protein